MTKQKVKVASAEPQAFDLTKYKTKSEAIRTLAAQGMPRAEIARTMGILYQHVRNVLTQPAKKTK